MIIAKEAGQLRYEPSKKTLISEDLHLDWLNKQDQRIAELEEQLKNAIVPKFKIGQEVYVIENKNIFKDVLEEIEITEDGILFYVEEGIYGLEENEIFATKEEAQAKLKELGE